MEYQYQCKSCGEWYWQANMIQSSGYSVCDWCEKTTADLKMTKSQERELERAILYVWRSNRLSNNYRLRRLRIRTAYGGALQVSMDIDNGLPGTLGYEMPTHACFFVGPRGGFSCYRYSKKEHGIKALIYSTT